MSKTNLCGKFETRVELSKFNNNGLCECMGCVDHNNCNNCEKMLTSSHKCDGCKSVRSVDVPKICLYCENSGPYNHSNERICFDVTSLRVEVFGPRCVKWNETCSNFVLSGNYRNRQR
ncbi:MAG: hypothetical protein MJ187_01940 [Alphaproteobacteria bacterium]|nr:hypothetical protein [Alphaproteobacteria bacterium]